MKSLLCSREPLINSSKPVIASVARQSHTLESVSWRLPRHFVPRNDGLIQRFPGIFIEQAQSSLPQEQL